MHPSRRTTLAFLATGIVPALLPTALGATPIKVSADTALIEAGCGSSGAGSSGGTMGGSSSGESADDRRYAAYKAKREQEAKAKAAAAAKAKEDAAKAGDAAQASK